MKRMIVKVFSLATLFISCFSIQAFSIQEDVLQDRYPASGLPETGAAVPLQKLDDFDYYFTMDLHQGFDNNVNLDSQRNDDGFLMATANAELSYEKFDGLNLIGGVDFFNITYYKYAENSLANLNPYVGFDWELVPNFIWKNRLELDWYIYPHDKESTYLAGEASSYLKQVINNNFYHELGYEYTHRWYGKDKVLLHNRAQGTDERVNSRNKIRHNIGADFENYSVRLANEFYINDSNYDYQDYYDYWVYRVRPSVMYFFSDKLYTNVSFTYRYTDYKDRHNTQDSSEGVHDNTYIITTSFYFDLNKDFTIGVTYSYRENHSNDPIQKYSGSTVSAGVYYTY